MSLPRTAIKYQAITLTTVVLAMVAGLIAFFTMPRRENPQYTVRTAIVRTLWPGATAEKVEELITDPIESAIDAIDEVDYVASTTTTGQSVVFVMVEDTVSGDNIDNIWDQVRAKVETVAPALPRGAGPPLVNDDFGDTYVMLLALYQTPIGDADEIEPDRRYSPRQLEIFAEKVQDNLKLLPGVARVDLFGVRKEAIYLQADLGTWNNLSLTTEELRQLLESRNIVAPGGTLDTPRGRYTVTPSGEFDAVRQIDRLIVGMNDQRAPVYLEDLGLQTIRDYEDPPSVLARYGDPHTLEPTVLIAFTMKAGHNITDLGAAARNRLAELKNVDKIIPPDIDMTVISDQPSTVEQKIHDFIINVIQAIVIIIAVAYLIIGLRMAAVMAASIPLVILTSVALIRVFGVELEQVSIAALIIALGMLVDNAIEVCEQSHRLQHEGRDPYRASVEGTEQVMTPILMATLTTIAAFAPMLVALSGSSREYVSSLPITVSTTLAVSWLGAVTFVTWMAYKFIRPAAAQNASTGSPLMRIVEWSRCKWAARKDRPAPAPLNIDRIYQGYTDTCRFCLRHKQGVIFAAVIAFFMAINLPVGTEFFPSDKRNQFAIDIWLPESATIEQTDETTRQVERILQELSPLRDRKGRPVLGDKRELMQRLAAMRSSVGQGGARWYLGLNPEQPQPNYAQIAVRTTDAQYTDDYIDDLQRVIDQGDEALKLKPVAGARIIPRKLDLGPPVDAPVGLRLYGPGFADIPTLRRLAERMKDILRNHPDTWDVHDTWGAQGFQLRVKIDEDKAKPAGVTNADIARTLNAFYSGHYLTTYREGDHQIDIFFRLPPEQRKSLDNTEIFVEGRRGKVPLKSIATIEPRWEPVKIMRRDLNRMIEVRARVDEGVLANNVLADVIDSPEYQKLLDLLPSGYYVEIGGEQEESTDSQAEMQTSFGISLLLIVLCLVVQFNSFAKPVIILVTLPLATIGAFVGLFITGNSLGFMPQLGLLALFGIVLNIAIVYIEFAETLIKDKLARNEVSVDGGDNRYAGLTRETFEACLAQAGSMRLLPITLTTLTTVGGLIPLALFGGPLWEGMAYALIFGLLVASGLTLLILPALYAFFMERFRFRVATQEISQVSAETDPNPKPESTESGAGSDEKPKRTPKPRRPRKRKKPE